MKQKEMVMPYERSESVMVYNMGHVAYKSDKGDMELFHIVLWLELI